MQQLFWQSILCKPSNALTSYLELPMQVSDTMSAMNISGSRCFTTGKIVNYEQATRPHYSAADTKCLQLSV